MPPTVPGAAPGLGEGALSQEPRLSQRVTGSPAVGSNIHTLLLSALTLNEKNLCPYLIYSQQWQRLSPAFTEQIRGTPQPQIP